MKPHLALWAAALATLPLCAEARTWHFRVLLDGREIGRHHFTQESRGEELRIVSEASFEVRFLFVTAFSYRHRAVEQWRGDCLTGLEAQTDTNGEREEVRLSPQGSRWRVERTAGREVHSGCLQTFAYWNSAVLSWPRLLNAQTGELLPVTATLIGNETLSVRGRPTATTRHRLVAPKLSIDLWYAQGEWVALESPTEGGKRLRYELL